MVEVAGEKIVPIDDAGFVLENTLNEPDMISVAASGQRLQLARDAKVLHSALDAAATAGASNSLEMSSAINWLRFTMGL